MISAAEMPVRAVGVIQRSEETRHEHIKTNASIGVGLRIEEHLDSADTVGMSPVKIGGHEVGKIVLGP